MSEGDEKDSGKLVINRFGKHLCVKWSTLDTSIVNQMYSDKPNSKSVDWNRKLGDVPKAVSICVIPKVLNSKGNLASILSMLLIGSKGEANGQASQLGTTINFRRRTQPGRSD